MLMGMQKQRVDFSSFKGIIDSTLREGQQFCRADFSLSQQRRIVRWLTEVGVDFIEYGNPVDNNVRQTLRKLLMIKDVRPFMVHVRNRLEDVKQAMDLDISGVNVLVTLDEERINGMKKTYDEFMMEFLECVRMVKERGLLVRVSVEHFFSTSKTKSLQLFKVAEASGVDRIGIADTKGLAMPWDVEAEIGYLRKSGLKMDIEVHFHNDLGNATANAFQAVRSGANWVSTTLAGVGERTGITPLSSFLAGMYVFDRDMVQKYCLGCLTEVENELVKMVGIEMPFNMLTNRQSGFSHKAGIHLDAMMKYGPSKYELMLPGILGNQRSLLVGTMISGKTSKKDVESFTKKHGKS